MTERDDTHLRSLVCPHCRCTIPITPVDTGCPCCQLLFLRCPACGEEITKDEITDARREYEFVGTLPPRPDVFETLKARSDELKQEALR